jgi:hypothetical protein
MYIIRYVISYVFYEFAHYVGCFIEQTLQVFTFALRAPIFIHAKITLTIMQLQIDAIRKDNDDDDDEVLSQNNGPSMF